MEENIDDIQLQELRHKHIILRNLQKIAIKEIDALEAKNVKLTHEIEDLKKSITALTNNNVINQKLMLGALTNNNSMKDDYRNRIQALEAELAKYKNK